MKKMLALFCSVAVLFAFTAFDWGSSSNQKAESKTPAVTPPPPASPNADAITALNNLLGPGTPEERQAKLDTLVRLSQILPAVAPQGIVTTQAPAAPEKPTYQETRPSTKRRW